MKSSLDRYNRGRTSEGRKDVRWKPLGIGRSTPRIDTDDSIDREETKEIRMRFIELLLNSPSPKSSSSSSSRDGRILDRCVAWSIKKKNVLADCSPAKYVLI